MADTLEQRAREILAAEYPDDPTLADLICRGEARNVDMLRGVRAIAAALQAQQPGAQAVAWSPKLDEICGTVPREQRFPDWAIAHVVRKLGNTAWTGETIMQQAALHAASQTPPYTHPQPPSIPEPSEEDVEAASIASGLPIKFPKDRKRVVDALTTYTARLRERIGGDGDA